jgi:hypothetical protein
MLHFFFFIQIGNVKIISNCCNFWYLWVVSAPPIPPPPLSIMSERVKANIVYKTAHFTCLLPVNQTDQSACRLDIWDIQISASYDHVPLHRNGVHHHINVLLWRMAMLLWHTTALLQYITRLLSM